MAAFAVLEGLIICVLYLCLAAPVATMGPFSPGDSPFRAVGELVGCVQVPVGTVGPLSPCDSPSWAVGSGARRKACGMCPKSRDYRARASPFEFYLDGKL